LAAASVITASDGSQVIINAGTNINPCSCMNATYAGREKLPDQLCLPAEATTITVIDVTPNGRTFNPAATLHYKLPVPGAYPAGYDLYIYQYVPGTPCNPPGQTSWVSVSTGPAEVIATQDFADGPFDHTTLFALVDLRGKVNAMGTLVSPFEAQDDGIVFGLRVVGSSTHPELKGHEGKVLLRGVQTGVGPDVLNERFKVGSMLLLHHESNGRLTIWSGQRMVQFFVKEIVFQ
jgi:hypothetical protein